MDYVVDNPRLVSKVVSADNMTVEYCTSITNSLEYPWAGVEYGRERWTGPSLKGSLQAGSGCMMSRAGNITEFCGGSSRQSLHRK